MRSRPVAFFAFSSPKNATGLEEQLFLDKELGSVSLLYDKQINKPAQSTAVRFREGRKESGKKTKKQNKKRKEERQLPR